VRKARLIELMHDFVLFDGGVKKLPRVHQYFGIKAAQAHVQRRQGRHHLAHPGQRARAS
jgi:type I restriction enzyme R subunit